MKGLVARLDRRWYPDCTANWDDEVFRERIERCITRHSVVLDVGAGAGIVPQMNFRGIVGRVCGIDLDPRVATNPYLDQAQVASADALPFQDDAFDVVFSDNVLEHLSDPLAAFREIARVLRPGGRFFAKTPNKWHYMPMIARITPHGFHRFYNKLRGREGEDTFRTMYRANSPRVVRELARASGLNVENIELIERRPEYLRLSALTYAMGRAYERLVNSSSALSGLRIVMIMELVKPPEHGVSP